MRKTQKNGDYFRTVRLGGFHKADVMHYIEALEQRLHSQGQEIGQKDRQLRELRKMLLRWMAAARLERKRGAAAQQVQRELGAFERQLNAAQALAAEIERENHFLRERIRVLEEEPSKLEPPSVPLEQLTFERFLEELDALDQDG